MKYFFFLFFLSISLHAEFVWEHLVIEHQASLGETEFVASFPFELLGEGEFEVLSVRTSCGCTTPALDKMKYASGESGELKAVFRYGHRSGHQEKRISFKTLQDGVEVEYLLTLKVDIPVLLKVEPAVLSWFLGSEFVEKEVEVSLHSGLSCELVLGEYQQDAFIIREVWAPGRRSVILRVRPRDVEDTQTFRISVNAKNEGQILANKSIYCLVRSER